MSELTKEVLKKLTMPFDPSVISWKPGATTRDKDRCLALAYAEPRAYYDRLNEVAGGHWSDKCEVVPMGDRVFVISEVTVFGVTRTDVGEEVLGSGGQSNELTSAIAQAFKRACVKFGLGAYLYSLPQEWVDYDGQRKRITDKGKKHLDEMIRAYSAPPVAQDPDLAALMTTPRGTALGDCTPLQLKQVMEGTQGKPGKNAKLYEGAETLFDWIVENFGPTAEDKTYNELKDEVK